MIAAITRQKIKPNSHHRQGKMELTASGDRGNFSTLTLRDFFRISFSFPTLGVFREVFLVDTFMSNYSLTAYTKNNKQQLCRIQQGLSDFFPPLVKLVSSLPSLQL